MPLAFRLSPLVFAPGLFAFRLKARGQRLTLGANAVVVKARGVHSYVGEVDGETVRYRSGVEFVEPPAYVGAAIASYLETLRGRPL